jgi:excisionase family DNA binding protein
VKRESDNEIANPPLLVTFERAAELLSISRRTVVRLCESGKLEVIRVTPDAPRLRFEDVERLAHQQKD